MKMRKQKGPRCLVYSAAMLFDVEPEDILNFTGHDALSGVHIQEIQAFAHSIGYALVPYEPRPVLEGVEVQSKAVEYLREEPFLDTHQGLLFGETASGRNHVVAWDGKMIFDPSVDCTFASYTQFWAKVKLS